MSESKYHIDIPTKCLISCSHYMCITLLSYWAVNEMVVDRREAVLCKRYQVIFKETSDHFLVVFVATKNKYFWQEVRISPAVFVATKSSLSLSLSLSLSPPLSLSSDWLYCHSNLWMSPGMSQSWAQPFQTMLVFPPTVPWHISAKSQKQLCILLYREHAQSCFLMEMDCSHSQKITDQKC